MDQRSAARLAAELRAIPKLRWELNRVTADLDQKIVNARQLSSDAERLKRELRPSA
jgi:hypothetical protein